MFPLAAYRETKQNVPATEDNEEDAIDTMLELAPRYLKSRAVVAESDSDIPRPGTLYARYRQESDLPDSARAFYETAAKVVGISTSTLVRCVSQGEIQIKKWLEDQRRIEHFAEQEMETSGESEADDLMEEISDGEDSGNGRVIE